MPARRQPLTLALLLVTAPLGGAEGVARADSTAESAYLRRAADVAQAGPFTERTPLGAVGELAFGVCDAREHVFAGAQFPAIDFRDAERVAALLGGSPQVRVTFVDAAGDPVTVARRPGRYGAMISVRWPNGESSEFTRNLFRADDGSLPAADHSEAAAMQLAAGPGKSAAADAGAWWYGIRKRAGTAQPYECLVIAPAEPPSPGQRLPAVVYLHGRSGFAAPDLATLKDDRWIKPLLARRDLRAYLIIPHSRQRWEGPPFAEMLDRICRDHAVDPAAITAFGYSAGASGAWQIALNAPGRLAGIATLAGTPPPLDAADRLAGTHVWAWYGDRDYPGPLAGTRDLVELLRKRDPASQFTLLPGLNHDQLPGDVFARPELYAWLTTQRRPQ